MSTPDAEGWITKYYDALDARRLDEAMRYFAPDASMKANHNEAVIGVTAIEEQFRQMFDVFEDIRHDLVTLWQPEPNLLVFEMLVTWKRPGIDAITLPGAAIGRTDGERWLEQRVYADLAPAFA